MFGIKRPLQLGDEVEIGKNGSRETNQEAIGDTGARKDRDAVGLDGLKQWDMMNDWLGESNPQHKNDT